MPLVSVTDKVKFVSGVFGSYNLERSGANIYVRCPRCAPSDPNKRKLGILLENDAWHCYTCGGGGYSLWPLILRYGSRQQLLDYRDRFMSTDHRRRIYLDDVVVEPPRVELPADFKLIVTSSLRDPDVLAIRRYLTARHVTDRDMWYFKLGYSNELRWRRRVIVPSFDADGQLNHFVGRAIDVGRRPKYDMPDTKTSTLVFNELNIDWSLELVLCEGTFDLMKCPDNSVPLLGSDLNEQSALFNLIVAHNTPVALALDADMRYRKMPKIARKLAEYNIVVRIVEVSTDPGEMTKGQIKSAVVRAQHFSWDVAFRDKLEQASRVRLGR